MFERRIPLLRDRVLIIDSKLASTETSDGRAIHALADEFRQQGLDVIESFAADDGLAIIRSDASITCVFVDWMVRSNGHAETPPGKEPAFDSFTTGGNDPRDATELVRKIRTRRPGLPIFLMGDRASNHTPGVDLMSMAHEFVWMLEDTAPHIAGRARAAIRRYLEHLLPPFTETLFAYTSTGEYSWAAPGHQGGVAFTKNPAGRAFFDFFGENLFRADSGIERTVLGSLLDHEGPVAEAERLAARVFGAQRSYSGTTGTSGSNRAVIAGVLADGQFAICDRNCHKSIEQGLVTSGGIPLFLRPTRNRYGVIGPISPAELDPSRIAERIASHPLAHLAHNLRPAYSVITNSTYDGLCYDAAWAEDLLDASTDLIHFDEAWFAYARFHPLYERRFAMRGDPADHPAERATVIATQSTHKLLAALSQASYIHLRNGRRPIIHSQFNEAYMAQASTSPMYAIIASNEIAATMMDGPQGTALTEEVIGEAVDFRQSLARAHRELASRGEWFFEPWNARHVCVAGSDDEIAFVDAPRDLLISDPSVWGLRPGDVWHGFDDLPEGWCMLDPTKVGIVCPGMGDDGSIVPGGVPAPVLAAYLHRHSIVPSRVADFMVLCLFSVGITKGKWGTLINALFQFKTSFDANESLSLALPDLVRTHPSRYSGMGIADLCAEMLDHMATGAMDEAQAEAFDRLPEPMMTPRAANARLHAGDAELLTLDEMPGRTIAIAAIPYPPGIPVLIPGEAVGGADEPWLTYLRQLQDWGRAFPGFERLVEGAEIADGNYRFWCVATPERGPESPA